MHENKSALSASFRNHYNRDGSASRNRDPPCDRFAIAIITLEESPCRFERFLACERYGRTWEVGYLTDNTLHVVHESFPISRNRTQTSVEMNCKNREMGKKREGGRNYVGRWCLCQQTQSLSRRDMFSLFLVVLLRCNLLLYKCCVCARRVTCLLDFCSPRFAITLRNLKYGKYRELTYFSNSSF